MKKIGILLTGMLLLMGFNSCKKKDHSYPKVPPPHWEVKDVAAYSSSMTVVVTVPKNLISAAQDGVDEVSAFIGGVCRGVGTPVADGINRKEFFIMIHGNASEGDGIAFKYYSAHLSKMFGTGVFLPFAEDGTYGSVDAPEVLDLHPVR